ncbi:MAG TPA: sugar phosphate isomerase/epimerase family protein [Planctomycetota bacterium]|nr:sugar phosphate isomerase/epimerase family protein [Planctomycetota bacterium]
MFLSGIADEAGKSIDVQVKAHKELGFTHIELRTIDGVNCTDLPEDAFEAVFRTVAEAGLQVSCFASQLGNWARPISGGFQTDVAELLRAAPRMHRFGTRSIRCMSWPNDKEHPLPDAAWRAEAVRRLRELARIAEANDVVLVHENCDGWGGRSPEHTLDLIDAVNTPSFKLVFDTGNPVEHCQDGWAFYRAVKAHIVYVHIKDYLVVEGGGTSACFAGEGRGKVKEILADLIAGGYGGGVSIEPHLAAVIHLAQDARDPAQAYRLYVEYGRRAAALVRSLGG